MSTSKNTRRQFLKAIVGGVLGAAGAAALIGKSDARECAKCGVPCAYCRGTCQVDRGHAGNHVCENLHTWYGPRRRTTRPNPTCRRTKPAA